MLRRLGSYAAEASRSRRLNVRDGVAVRTNKFAFRDLRFDYGTAVPPRERCNIGTLHRSRQMVESHRRRMELASAVSARSGLASPHPCDMLHGTLPLLRNQKVSTLTVVGRVVVPAARFAPVHVTTTKTVKFRKRLSLVAKRAPAQFSLRIGCFHAANYRTGVRIIQLVFWRRRPRTRSIRMVGVAGFEPAASSSRTKCSTKLSHTPSQRILAGPRLVPG